MTIKLRSKLLLSLFTCMSITPIQIIQCMEKQEQNLPASNKASKKLSAEKIDYFSLLPLELQEQIIDKAIDTSVSGNQLMRGEVVFDLVMPSDPVMSPCTYMIEKQVQQIIALLKNVTTLAQVNPTWKAIIEGYAIKRKIFHSIPSDRVLNKTYIQLTKPLKIIEPSIPLIQPHYVLRSYQNDLKEFISDILKKEFITDTLKKEFITDIKHAYTATSLLKIAQKNPNLLFFHDTKGTTSNLLQATCWVFDRNRVDLVDELVTNGALVNKENYDRETVLTCALNYKQYPLAIHLMNTHKAIVSYIDLYHLDKNCPLELLGTLGQQILKGNSTITLEKNEHKELEEILKQDNANTITDFFNKISLRAQMMSCEGLHSGKE